MATEVQNHHPWCLKSPREINQLLTTIEESHSIFVTRHLCVDMNYDKHTWQGQIRFLANSYFREHLDNTLTADHIVQSMETNSYWENLKYVYPRYVLCGLGKTSINSSTTALMILKIEFIELQTIVPNPKYQTLAKSEALSDKRSTHHQKCNKKCSRCSTLCVLF